MREHRNMELVEQLGSGMPRILKTYDESYFFSTENHSRTTLPMEHVTEQVIAVVEVLEGEMERQEIQDKLGLLDR